MGAVWSDKNDRAWLEITDIALNVGQMYEFLNSPDAGAIVVFSGTVRSYSEVASDVKWLEYETYVDLAADRLSEIATNVFDSFDEIRKLAIWHRVGRVNLVEASVLVGCSAGHRGEAFDAARYAIDTVKTAVPIWKDEVSATGREWSPGSLFLDQVPKPRGSKND
jgi:molybdopterin synthase catalytic subunit